MTEHGPSSFGALLRDHRLSARWTQQELAEAAGLSVEAIAALERGTRRTPRHDTALRLADALELNGPDRTRFLSAIHPPLPAHTDTAAEVDKLADGLGHGTRRHLTSRKAATALATIIALLAMSVLAMTVFSREHDNPALHLKLLSVWTDPEPQSIRLLAPVGVAVDRHDAVYVVDRALDVVAKLSPRGDLLALFGGPGSTRGLFHDPESVAVDGRGDIFIADAGNRRIQMLSPAGQFLAQWGGAPGGRSRFLRPVGVAADDRGGNIYVADVGLGRLFHLTRDGRDVWQRDLPARAVTVDRFGVVSVLVRPPNANRNDVGVLKYLPSGQRIGVVSPVTEREVWPDPRTIATDHFGSLAIGMGPNGLDVNTGYTSSVVPFAAALRSVDGLAIDAQQRAYVADSSDHVVMQMDLTGHLLRRIQVLRQNSRQPWTPEGIEASGNGVIYVADTARGKVEELNAHGRLTQFWYVGPNGTGELSAPQDVAQGADGRIYISDPDGGRIYTVQQMYVVPWREAEAVPARAVAADHHGFIYAIIGQFIQKFDDSGQYVSAISEPAARDIAADGAGNLYVARGALPIRKLAPDGRQLAAVDVGRSSADAIAIDREHRICMVDRARGVLSVLAPDGTVLESVGVPGTSPARFARPTDVSVDARGRIYVSDTGGHRIQVFGLP